MSEAFDPYLKWLAILPEEQPANHYRLLGVPLFLDDADVIENAADQRMAHVRTFGMGKHADLSQTILNEISAAKVLLLDPEKKAAYDKPLRAKLAAMKKQRGERPKLKTRRVTAAEVKPQPAPAGIEVTPREKTTVSRLARRRKKPLWQQPAMLAIGAVLLLAAIGGAVMLSGDREDPEVARGDTKKKTHSVKTSDTNNSTTEKLFQKQDEQPPAALPPDTPDTVTPPREESETTVSLPTFTFEKVDDGPSTSVEDTTDTPDDKSELPAVQLEKVEKRLPVPDEASLADKQALIADLYADQIKAARTQAAKGELAQKLLDAGRQTENDPVGKYALLDKALEHAIESGQVELATDSIEVLSEDFEVDALQLNIDALLSTARTVADKEQRANLAQLAIKLTNDTIRADRFDEAEKLCKMIASAARNLREPSLSKASNALRARIRLFKAGWEASEKAIATLEEQPDNREAHLARGKYLALVKQDWQAGLPHLAKGSDPALVTIAQQEAASPEAADDRFAIANRWYNWAGRASGTEKDGALVRALHWYQNVAGDVSSQQVTIVNKRIDELSEKVGPITSGVARLSWIKGPVGLIREFKEHGGLVKSFDVSADGRYALTGSNDHTLRICDLSTGEEKRINTGADADPAAFTPDSGHVIVQDGWSNTSLIDWRTEERIWKNVQIGRQRCIAILSTKPLAITIDSAAILHGWNYTTGKKEFSHSVPKDAYRMAITPDGRQALLGQSRSKLSIFDLAAGKVAHEPGPPPDKAWMTPDVAISPDGKWGLSAGSVGPARLWDLRTGKLVLTLPTFRPNSCDFSPDGQRVALAAVGKLDVWQLKTKSLLHSFTVVQPAGGAIRFTPDGRGIISAVADTGVIRIHRIADPE